jgi:hypothetical protein
MIVRLIVSSFRKGIKISSSPSQRAKSMNGEVFDDVIEGKGGFHNRRLRHLNKR